MPSRIALSNNFNVYFPYNPLVISSIRSIEGRRWNAKFKRWEVPVSIDNLKILQDILPQPIILEQTVIDWYNRKVNEELKNRTQTQELLDKIPSWSFKTMPYSHQKKAFVWGIMRGSGALFFECGLGKTKTILDLIQYLCDNNILKKILIVIPLSVVYTWEQEIQIHTNFKSEDIEFLVKYPIEERKKRLAETDKRIYVINYDAIPDMQEAIIKKEFDMIVCDESTYIKSIKAKRTKAIQELGKYIPRRWIMTGTPFGQRVPDIYSQVKFVAPDIFAESFFSFRNKYCEMGGYKGYEIVGYKNLDDLNKRISQIALLYKKEECLDLPPKIYQSRYCDLSPEQIKHYKELIDYLVTIKDNSVIEVPMILSQMMKLTQITSGFLMDKEGRILPFKDNPKLKLLCETLDEISGKVVIMNRFIHDIDIIRSILPESSYVIFTGETNEKEREEALDKFNKDNKCRYFITTSAGGYGLNLQVAQTIIFFSHEWSLEKRLQTEDRIHRVGQSGNSVVIIDLMCNDTIDKYIVRCLREKKEFTNNIINDLNLIIGRWKNG